MLEEEQKARSILRAHKY